MRTKDLMFLLLIFSLVGALLGQTAEQLPIPVNIKFAGDTLIWDGVENAIGYTVNIINATAEWIAFDVTENIFIIPENHPKELVDFRVKAKGDDIYFTDSKWSSKIRFNTSPEQLPTPKHLNITGNVLSWGYLPYAIGYTVYIINGVTDEWLFYGITDNRFNIPDRFSYKEWVGFRVIAIGDNIYTLDSEWSETIYGQPETIKLATPTNLKLVDDILSWDEVENAIGYTVNIITALTVVINYDVTENNFKIPDQYLRADFQVKANSDGSYYSDSDWSEIISSLPQLPVPKNLKIRGMVLTWDEVLDAFAYIVDVRTPAAMLIHIVVADNNFNIPEQYIDAIFAVKAMGDNIYYTHSDWSEPIQAAEEEERLNENDKVISQKAGLLGNYPNPFNPTTSISFVLPNNSFVNLDVYNTKGQKVRSLAGGSFTAGQHSIVWNGRDDNGSAVSSGVYFYRITTNEYTETKKMIMIK